MIRIVDVRTHQISRELNGHVSDIWSVSWGRDGRLASCGLRDETVRTWKISELDHNRTLVRDSGEYALEIDRGQRRIRRQALRLGCTGSLRAERIFLGSADVFAVSPDGKRIAHGGPKSGLFIWDAANDVDNEIPMDAPITDLDWSQNGRLAGSLKSGEIAIWDNAGVLVRTIQQAYGGELGFIDWSSDGRLLASMRADSTIRMWEVATGQMHWRSAANPSLPGEVSFSRDGSRLAVTCRDVIVIYDVASGRQIGRLNEVSERFRTLAWSPDDSRRGTGQNLRRDARLRPG